MSWNWRTIIKNFLDPSSTGELYLGDRTPRWIASFEKDIERWGFPVELIITNPIIVKGKVPCKLIKKELGEK